jgi:hypothetical protein
VVQRRRVALHALLARRHGLVAQGVGGVLQAAQIPEDVGQHGVHAAVVGQQYGPQALQGVQCLLVRAVGRADACPDTSQVVLEPTVEPLGLGVAPDLAPVLV